MICSGCNKKKKIEEVNKLVYKREICQDCVDYDQNMRLTIRTKERFERFDNLNK